MSDPQFLKTQAEFIAHLRDPEQHSAPSDVEDRRMAIYRDLIYNNIENFISGNFPILRQIIADKEWHEMVRDFIRSHQSHTPYFVEIAQEFLAYLQQDRANHSTDPAFLLELAHYEWVELALDVSTEEFPISVDILSEQSSSETPSKNTLVIDHDADLLAKRPIVSPLAWNLSYQFPVHQIGPDFQPETPSQQPTFLVVYRNRDDEVKFMESNSATSRLLTILSLSDSAEENHSQDAIESQRLLTGETALLQLAEEMQAPDPAAILDFGKGLLNRLRDLDVICGGV